MALLSIQHFLDGKADRGLVDLLIIGSPKLYISGVIFATLPEGDLETALKMFEMAEGIEPGFYSRNLLLLAKTLLQLGRDKEKATESLVRVVKDYSKSEKWDDKEVSPCRTKDCPLIDRILDRPLRKPRIFWTNSVSRFRVV